MSSRFIDWLTNLTAKSTTIDGSEITHIGSSGLSQKATLANVIQYGGGATRNETAGNATVTRNTSGALWLEVAGQTAGNARGAGAFDWQAVRTAGANVASGTNAIAIGENCTASALYSIAIGRGNSVTGAGSSVAIGGFQNSVTAGNAFATGRSCTVSGSYGFAWGYGSVSANTHQAAWGCPNISGTQGNLQTFYTATTDASAKVLNITNTDADRMVIPPMRACAITGLVTAMSDATDGYKVKAWEIRCVITRDNSNNTRIVGTPTITVLGNDTEAAGWAITSITADDTNESLAITVTGEASTNIRWQASLFYGQVGY